MIYRPLDIGATVYTQDKFRNTLGDVVVNSRKWQVLASSESKHPTAYVSLLEDPAYHRISGLEVAIVKRQYLYSSAEEAIKAEE